MMTDLPLDTLIGHRYQRLDELGRGGMGVVYKAHDRLTGETVALKQVSVPAKDLQFSRLTSSSDNTLALALEFRALASLRHPNIVAVLDYGFQDRDAPFYTMQYLDQAASITEQSKTLSREQKIGLIIQVLSALIYLHRHHILHRDLKPQNIFVLADQTVKVMDFGLAIDHRDTAGLASTGGTFAYMAPELLAGELASIQSDLYAVGIIAYEMLVGVHPFKADDISQMMTDIFLKTPDLSMFDEKLAQVIERLLAKVAPDRFPDAASAVAAFYEAADLPLPRENAVIRESFLQASSFVGRESEMKVLKSALENVFAGQGSAYLIGGESGVGKTRLLDELRTRALMQGALVLRGQAVAEDGLPYQLWREPLRRLILNVSLTPLEASIMKDLIPDIGILLNREVNDAPPLSGQAIRLRLNRLITRLFQQQTQPVVLLLEDLQWIKDSLDLLNTLLPLIAQHPWLVVATYRDEEAPQLASQLSLMQPIKLERLSPTAVAELSEAMLGQGGNDPQVLDLIQRESEGNTFFIVEVVRELAEVAGGLDDIGLRTLPAKVFSGGIETVIGRRLARVSGLMREWIKWAAVQGRELDLKVCQVLRDAKATDSTPTLEQWVALCLETAVFEVHDEKWRFSHDKIREFVLRDLGDEERRGLHRQVAMAIEQIYPQQEERAANLYEHWSVVGDVLKQAAYATVITEQQLRHSNFRTVVSLVDGVLGLLEGHTNDEALTYKCRLLTDVGIARGRLGDNAVAEEYLKASLELALQLNNVPCQTKALNALGNVESDRGAYTEAAAHMEQSKHLAESLHNPLLLSVSLSSLGIVAYLRGKFAQAQDYWEEGIRCLEGPSYRHRSAGLMINLGSAAQVQGHLDKARQYWEQSRAIMLEVGDRNGYSMSLQGLGNIARDQGDYPAACAYYEEGITVYREIGNRQGLAEISHNLGEVIFLQGRFTQARGYYEQSLALRREINHRHGIGKVLISLANLALEERNFPQARLFYDEALQIFEALEEQGSVLMVKSGLAYVQLALQPDDPSIRTAFQHTLKAARDIGQSQTIFSSVLGLAGFITPSQPVLAAELVGWVADHAKAGSDMKTKPVAELRLRLEQVLSEAEIQAAMQRGHMLTEDEVIRRLLDDE